MLRCACCWPGDWLEVGLEVEIVLDPSPVRRECDYPCLRVWLTEGMLSYELYAEPECAYTRRVSFYYSNPVGLPDSICYLKQNVPLLFAALAAGTAHLGLINLLNLGV